VRAEALAGLHDVLVEHTQSAEAGEARVVEARKGVSRLQPTVVGMAAVGGAPDAERRRGVEVGGHGFGHSLLGESR
jgi:hypothetical protein